MLFRDLIERHNIPHPKAITDLAHRLADNTGSLYSINNLTGYLLIGSAKIFRDPRDR
jgi:predicted AAA+ superfamily ATPase